MIKLRNVFRARSVGRHRRRLNDKALVEIWAADLEAVRLERRTRILGHHDHCNCNDCTAAAEYRRTHKSVTVIDGDHTYVEWVPTE